LKQGMELEGHQAVLAEDGDAALVRVAEEHPDLVLLDLSLPRRDGLRCWRRCGRTTRTLRFWC